MIGQQLGHYRVVDRIGAGAMGVVYRARDQRLDRDVAIKILPAGLLADADARRRFRNEALALSRTAHPGIATIHDFDTQENLDFLVMEYIPGRPLSDVIAEGPLPLPRVLDLGTQLLEALDRAHAAGVIHRDLKPGNLRLTPEHRLKILDFGIARRLAAPDDPTRTETTGMPGAGTVPYMAPEQLRGAPVDARTDLYAAGAILYEMATGRRPFPERQEALLIDAILHEAPKPPRDLVPALPPGFDAVVLRALEKDPDQRQRSARACLAELNGLAIDPARASGARRARGRARPFPLPRWLAAAAGVAILVAVGLRVIPTPPPEPNPSAAVTPASAGRLKLAILPGRVIGATDGTGSWPALVQTLFASELTGLEQVGVVDPLSLESRLRQALGSQATGAPVMQLLTGEGIALAIEAQVLTAGGAHELRVNLIDTATGEIRFSRRAAIDSEPALPGVVSQLANEIVGYLDLQQGPMAIKDVRPWVSLRTHNIEAVRAFAQATQYNFSSQPAEVERYLRRAIELDPGFIAPRLWLFSALLARGRVPEAEPIYRELLELQARASPFEQAVIGYAGASLARDADAQIRYLELALQYSPGNNILLFNLGGLRAVRREYQSGLETLRPLVSARWPYPLLYPVFGLCAILTGQIDEARAALEAALEMSAVEPMTHALLEALALARGEAAGARRHRAAFDELSARLHQSGPAPTLARVYGALGTRADADGSTAIAETLFARAVDLDPDYADAHLMLGRALDRRGDVAGAVRAYQQYVPLAGDGPDRDAIRARITELERRQ